MRFIIPFWLMLAALPAGAQTGKRVQNHNVGGKETKLRQYYFVIVNKGEMYDRITDTAMLNQLQRAHLNNIRALTDQGKLLVAGPFGDDTYKRGVLIFDCETQEEVIRLMNTDPSVAAGRLSYEIHPWWTEMNCLFR